MIIHHKSTDKVNKFPVTGIEREGRRKAEKIVLPGNRKLVLRVIKENPGIRLWHIKLKLKKIHRDWHVSRYVLIRHVLGLHSSKLIIIRPKARIDDLKKFCLLYTSDAADE